MSSVENSDLRIPSDSAYQRPGSSVKPRGETYLPGTSRRIVPSCLFMMNTWPPGPVPKRKSARVAGSFPCWRFFSWIS